MMTLGTAAIIVTGGLALPPVGKSVEVLHGNGSHWCSLPDLPEVRYGHTQTGLEACGSFRAKTKTKTKTKTTCVKLSGGTWSPSHQLVEGRGHHCSWASPAGTLLMGAGQPTWKSGKATELLDETTGDFAVSFPLKYKTQ